MKGAINNCLRRGSAKSVTLPNIEFTSAERTRRSDKTFDVRKCNPVDYRIKNGRVPRRFKKYLPVTLGKGCKLVGSIGLRFQTESNLVEGVSKPKIFFFDKLGTKKDFSLTARHKAYSLGNIAFSGGFNTNWVNLKSMSENGRRSCYSNAEIFKAVRARWKIDLVLPYIASIPKDS